MLPTQQVAHLQLQPVTGLRVVTVLLAVRALAWQQAAAAALMLAKGPAVSEATAAEAAWWTLVLLPLQQAVLQAVHRQQAVLQQVQGRFCQRVHLLCGPGCRCWAAAVCSGWRWLTGCQLVLQGQRHQQQQEQQPQQRLEQQERQCRAQGT